MLRGYGSYLVDKTKRHAEDVWHNYNVHILIVLLVTIVGVVLFFVFVRQRIKTWRRNQSNPNQEFLLADEYTPTVDIYIFVLEWCPYSIQNMPVYQNFKTSIESKSCEKIQYKVSIVNAEDQEDSNHRLVSAWEVQRFPAVIRVKNGARDAFADTTCVGALMKFAQG